MSPTRTERRVMIAGALVVLVILIAALTAAVATAQESSSTATATATASGVATGAPGASTVVTIPVSPATPTTASVPSTTAGTTGGYRLDFTLPTYGKSGCFVCHGDPNLVVMKGDTTKSFWIDEEAYNHSAHKGIVCTGCHVDFGYSSPHPAATSDWRAVAKSACKSCHQDQYTAWSLSSHAPVPSTAGTPDPKAANKPLCGDCHGSHYMPVLKNNPEGQAAVHGQSEQMCGREGCHADYWNNYMDYYHGAAYKDGATDAPACWTCHGTHLILNSKDRNAPMNPENFGAANSCGQSGCHKGAGPAYESYSPMIHGRAEIIAENPVVKFFHDLFDRE